jgi:spore germination protein YaaH
MRRKETPSLARSWATFSRVFSTALISVLLLISVFLVSCDEAKRGRVELSLHPVEQLATRKGPKIVVSIDGKSAGELSAESPTLRVSVSREIQLTFSYVGPSGASTDVSWSQIVRPADRSVVVVQPWRRYDRNKEWHVLAWARPKERTKVLEQLPKAVTVVSPIWWTVDEQGVVQGDADADFTRLRRDGIALWPAIQGLDANGLHAFLANDSRRSKAAEQISMQAKMNGANGINIDIEGFRNEDSDAVVAFVEELAGLVRAWGGTISYDMVPRSDSWESLPISLSHWSNAPQRRRLAAAVDYTILMAYDQFNRHRPAGPVAAPNWVEEVLIYLLRYADPQSVMLGIPAYGQIWNPDALDAPRAVSLSKLNGRDGIRTSDEKYCVDRIVRPNRRFYWAEKDIGSARVKLARDYNLAGVAIWRLGLDYPQLWQAIQTLGHDQHSFFDFIREIWVSSRTQGSSCAVD